MGDAHMADCPMPGDARAIIDQLTAQNLFIIPLERKRFIKQLSLVLDRYD